MDRMIVLKVNKMYLNYNTPYCVIKLFYFNISYFNNYYVIVYYN